MQRDPRFDALFSRLNQKPSQPAGLLQKIGAIVATIIVFGLALTFSVVFFAVVVAAGALIWGYVWWRTRDLRKAMREAQARASSAQTGRRASNDNAVVIEGEVIREIRDEHREDPDRPR